ncbi:MAG: twin-arginine translocase TatA/TatE family subunit [bacterium]|uniref:Sec-independent protein translocase protein TatA n=1 Tax=Candidatus Aphodosoma intestinipullorum TaxID=2840674 RepID=A0A940IE26_9BACT|nr:twin-arginine translocase TatA/TatE family subunit [Candidatus Aphodosoma intestinipullorum]
MGYLLLLGLGMPEIIVIVLVVLLLFGGKKIPELMKGLGKGVRSFKEGMNDVQSGLDADAEKDAKSAPKDGDGAK